MWKNYITLWWRKPSGYSIDDDIRFVTGRYMHGGPWITRRVEYTIASRTGLCFRLRSTHNWRFIGFMVLSDVNYTATEDKEVKGKSQSKKTQSRQRLSTRA